MESSMYYATSMEQLTWDCFIQKGQIHSWLDMQM